MGGNQLQPGLDKSNGKEEPFIPVFSKPDRTYRLNQLKRELTVQSVQFYYKCGFLKNGLNPVKPGKNRLKPVKKKG